MCSFQQCSIKIEFLACALEKEWRWLVDLRPRTKRSLRTVQSITMSGEPSVERGAEPLTVELDESDVLGAMLSPPFEWHKVPELLLR